MTRAVSATGRAFLETLQRGDFDDELLAQRLADYYHQVACSKWRHSDDHLENEIVLFRIVVARLNEDET